MSFLMAQSVEKTGSPLNPVLEVSCLNGRLRLSTQNAIYSYEDFYTAFADSFRWLGIELYDIQQVLVLGYGLGSVPVILHKHYGMAPKITAVELDPAIIELAKKYYPELSRSVAFHAMDAEAFVAEDSGTYDLIVIDLFVDDVTPDKFNEPAFLQKVRELLSPKGLCLFNRIAKTTAQKELAERYYQDIFLQVFPDGQRLLLPGNHILIHTPAGSKD